MAEPRPLRPARRDPRLAALAEESGYEIHGRIGAGGMGIVYRAQDADGNDVAVKLLRHEISDDPRARDRLAREVAAQQRVRNDNIVRILDAELDSPDAFVVTEFVPGPTLEDAVRTHGGLHPEAVRELGLVMGATLRDIHAASVVHRDLKPSNVLLRGATEGDLVGFDPEGDRLDPVIIDFGIAIAAEESRLTSTGLVMGTAAYLDPEVVRTNHTGEAGDWWAWAALLAFAATGREPYGTGRADLVFLRAERGEIDVDGLPTELAQWLRAALRAAPEERTGPEELLEQLAELDLTHYEDPGPTEAFAADGRTAVLPALGAGEQGDSGGPGDAEAGAAEGLDGRTEALRTDQHTADQHTADHHSGGQYTPDQHTEVIDLGGNPTSVLPALATPVEPPTERIEPVGPVTEVMPTIGTETRQMPAVPPMPQPEHRQGGAQGPSHGAHDPSGYPVQRSPRSVTDPMGPPSAPYRSPGNPPQGQPVQTHPVQQAPEHGVQYQGHAGQPYAMPGHPHDPYAGAAPMAPYGAWPQQPPPPPRRPLLVWTGHLLIVGMAAIAPYVSLVLLLLLGALARTWERSHRAITAGRLRGATGSGPLWGAGAAWPFRFLLSLVEIALQALLPLVLGLLVGVAVDAAWTVLRGTAPPDAVTFGLAMAVTLLITWVGLGSGLTRAGAHRMVDAAAPDRAWSAVVAVLLLLLVVAVVTTVLARTGTVDYFPFPAGPRLGDIAVWRA